MRRSLLRSTLALAILWLAGAALAVPITYTFTGTGTGTAGTTAFTDAPFTIEVQADTDDVILSDQIPGVVVYVAPALSSTISITGVGSGQFTTDKLVFDNQTNSALGFSEANGTTVLFDLLGLEDPAFATYNLMSALGPVFEATPDPVSVAQFQNIPSTLGNITFSRITNVTFSDPATRINNLITAVGGLGLPKGTQNSFVAKLQAALAALEAGDTLSAIASLQDFINQARALSGKKLPADQAATLIREAQEILGQLGGS